NSYDFEKCVKTITWCTDAGAALGTCACSVYRTVNFSPQLFYLAPTPCELS
ncbi:MAG: hypothetical protein SGILL_004779, partial [Bacillariaceae sp.]